MDGQGRVERIRSILFVDPPAFCTAVEELVAPALRNRPLAVAPPGADRATILALSAEARAAGLARGMPLHRARKICRDLIVLPPNPRLYARASRALHEVLRRYAPVIEPRGYGHAFLDVTGTGRLFGPSADLAERIRRETRAQVRLALSVGAATNKLVSEAAAGVGKADGQAGSGIGEYPTLWVPGGEEADFLAPRPVELLPDVPERIRERLDDYQLGLIGEVAALSEAQLAAVFGPPGRVLRSQARGIDPRPVLPPEVRAEFRAAHTLATDSNDVPALELLLRRLTERLGRRLRERALAARRLTVALDYADYRAARRSVSLDLALLDVDLWTAARRAFALANRRPVAVRMVTVTVDRFLEAEGQMELWTSPPDPLPPFRRSADLQRALDRIRTRYGTRSVRVSG